MTFELLVYIECKKGLKQLIEDLLERDYSEVISVRSDDGDKEVWVDIEDNPLLLSYIRQCGYISEDESDVIFNKNSDTIVFY